MPTRTREHWREIGVSDAAVCHPGTTTGTTTTTGRRSGERDRWYRTVVVVVYQWCVRVADNRT